MNWSRHEARRGLYVGSERHCGEGAVLDGRTRNTGVSRIGITTPEQPIHDFLGHNITILGDH